MQGDILVKSKERVIKTVQFDNPDRIPIDLWIIPATFKHYGKQLEDLLSKYPTDISRIENEIIIKETNMIFNKGKYTDSWGCNWTNIQEGYFGEVKKPLLKDYSSIDKYKPPFEHFYSGWDSIEKQLENMTEKFVIASQVNPFERIQFIRGTENLFMDIAYKDKRFLKLLDMVCEYFKGMVKKWLKYEKVDAIIIADDWGTQRSLLISPDSWREVFKPRYKELIDIIKETGKYVFIHSDGCIIDIYEDFIELGADAINSQLWIMNVEEIARRFSGRITFWGELSRQKTLPFGGKDDIRKAAEKMKKSFFVNGGGLIGQCEIGIDVSLENIEEALTCWNK